MAIKLPDRNFFTFPELIQRWQCTENDIRNQIIEENIKPSYVINHVATKVKFYQETVDENTYWVPTEVNLTGEGRPKLFDTYGFYYLLHPYRVSSLECNFRLFSQDRNHTQGPDDENICLMLTGNHKGIWRHGVTLTQVMENGVVTAVEVASFESRIGPRDTEQLTKAAPSSSEKDLKSRELGTLLKIIAVLLELIKRPKPGRDSDADIIKEMLNNYSDKSGIKERTLQEKFAAAKRCLQAD